MDTKSSFDSLTWALDGWFDKRFRELPGALRQRVKRDFFPKAWGKLTADQRRSVAHEWDFEHDPGNIANRRFWQRYLARKENLEKQIALRKAEAARTADARAKKKADLAELEGELAFQAQQEQQERDNYQPERIPLVGARYIPFPVAMALLTGRLAGATPEELAGWVFMGPKADGLAAYTNANELDPPPRFSIEYFMGEEDYIAPLMRCWFWKDEIERFDPTSRYITGKTLIERWSKINPRPKAFIQARVEESRLFEFHPTCGDYSQDSNLYKLSDVEEIEAKDFGKVDDGQKESAGESGQATDIGGTAETIESAAPIIGFSICREGEIWTLTYHGKSSHHGDTKGLRYIQALARTPGKPIDVDTLYREVNPPDPGSLGSTLSGLTDEALDDLNLSKNGLGSTETQIDDKAHRQIKEKIGKLNESIEDAKERGNQELQEKQEEEREKLVNYLSANSGKDGRLRETDPIKERTRKAIGMALHRAIAAISKKDPVIGKYLDDCISTGTTTCCYTPAVISPLADAI